MSLRLRRGFLTAAVDGPSSSALVGDFERCLQLVGTDLREDELVATLIALGAYYISRADLRRATQVLESLRAGLEGRQWFRPALESSFGAVEWLRGEFDAARSLCEEATAAQAAAADAHELDAVWLHPSDPTVVAHLHLAWIRLVHGDLIDAEAELVHAARRAGQLGFPQGPFSLAYTRCMECWIRVEAGQLDRAAVLAADLTEQAERHGFDMFRVWGEALQAALSALAFVDADDPDPAGLSARIATMATYVDILHMVGMNVYITFHDAVLGRLLIAAGQPEAARERLDTALQLAEDTGMHFYDAELLRLRAHTHTDPDARRADIGAALDLARRQGATLFELRAALDDFELRGEPARAALADAASRIPTDSALPELARAEAAPKSSNPQLG